MDAEELRDRIAEFPRWHYRFRFDGGITTPVPDRGQINRHEQRRGYFFEALLSLTGGTLAGRRVLDLGCNAGFWSLAAIEAGAEHVLGIEARADFVAQAELVFEAKGVARERYRFEHASVFEHDLGGERVDVALCLGMLEVLAKPVELLERIAASGAELVVIDTALSRAPSSFLELGRLDDAQTRVEHELTLIPTRQAVIELAAEAGYRAVAITHAMSDYTGLEDYLSGRRLAFICARETALDGLTQAPPTASVSPWLPPAITALAERARVRRRAARLSGR